MPVPSALDMGQPSGGTPRIMARLNFHEVQINSRLRVKPCMCWAAQMPVPSASERGQSSGVTPQIMARPVVAAMVAHLHALLEEQVGCCSREHKTKT